MLWSPENLITLTNSKNNGERDFCRSGKSCKTRFKRLSFLERNLQDLILEYCDWVKTMPEFAGGFVTFRCICNVARTGVCCLLNNVSSIFAIVSSS